MKKLSVLVAILMVLSMVMVSCSKSPVDAYIDEVAEAVEAFGKAVESGDKDAAKAAKDVVDNLQRNPSAEVKKAVEALTPEEQQAFSTKTSGIEKSFTAAKSKYWKMK